MLVKCALFSLLALSISLIGVSGACAQSVLVPVQEKPALPQARPATAPVQIAPVANAPSDAPPLPSAEQLVSVVRNVLLAVNDANLTGNYTVLRDLSAPISKPEYVRAPRGELQANSPTGYRLLNSGRRHAPIVQLPTFTPQGYLRVNGDFNSSPRITSIFSCSTSQVVGAPMPLALAWCLFRSTQPQLRKQSPFRNRRAPVFRTSRPQSAHGKTQNHQSRSEKSR